MKTDKFTLFVYCYFLVLLSTTVSSQNINKQNVNIADEILAGYSFLSRYHYTKSKNYFKRRYRNRHWIPMFIGTPCMINWVTGTNSDLIIPNLCNQVSYTSDISNSEFCYISLKYQRFTPSDFKDIRKFEFASKSLILLHNHCIVHTSSCRLLQGVPINMDVKWLLLTCLWSSLNCFFRKLILKTSSALKAFWNFTRN